MSHTGKNPSLFSVWFMVFMGVLAGLSFFNAGRNGYQHDYTGMALAIVLGTFELLLFFVVMAQEIGDAGRRATAAERDAEFKVKRVTEAAENAVKELADEMHKAIEELSKPTHHDQMEAAVHEALDAVTGGDRAPTAEEVPAVEDKFHEITGDHYLRLEVVEGGITVEVRETPFESTTATATTTVGDAMDAVKPTKSKSQKRREAAMKDATKKG